MTFFNISLVTRFRWFRGNVGNNEKEVLLSHLFLVQFMQPSSALRLVLGDQL